MPALEAALGPGVAEALARTAGQLRADAECLDDLAFAESGQLRQAGSATPAGLDVTWLAALPAAIRTRVLRDAAVWRAARPARSAPGTSARSTRWSPPGTGSAGGPARRGARVPPGWQGVVQQRRPASWAVRGEG